MLKKILLSLTVASSVALPFSGYAITAADAFVKAPSSVMPLIEESTRLDMIDYFNAGSDRASRNALYGNSRITSLTPEHIVIEATAASTFEIITLAGANDTVLAVIQTVASPVPDSKITLYSSSWEALPAAYFTAPDIEQWLSTEAGKSGRDEVEAMLPFMLSSCAYNPESREFVFTNRAPEFLSEEVYEPLKPLLRSSLTYAWDGKRLAIRK